MKSHVADYRWRIHALRIEAVGGQVVRFVEYPHDLVMGANTYKADSGYQFTDYSTTSSTSASVVDLEGILLAGGINRDQLASGVWDNAKMYLFATTWVNPTEDEEPLGKFIFGKTRIIDDRYACEMMHIIDALNQDVGRSIIPTCPWEFGGVECGVDLGPHTYTGTITDVESRVVFGDSGRLEADGFFDFGTLEFTTGNNVGLRPLEIQRFTSDSNGGTFEIFLPFHYEIQIGDQYTVVRGCSKLREACKGYDNILNFGGFPDQPTNNMVNKVGGQ
jgi:uncharacterized phage protein (TIGR02218 family)